MIKKEVDRMIWLAPVIEDGRALIANQENCERVWQSSHNYDEVKRAQRLLILRQRREWLLDIRREIMQKNFFEKEVRRLNRKVPDDETSSRKAKRRRIEKIQVTHDVMCKLMKYEGSRKEEEGSKI